MKKTNLVFLDTETTGRGPEDRLCQVAYKFDGQEVEALFKPPLPIEIEAMAVTHITNKMVADKEPFLGSDIHKHLGDIFSSDNILVAHNAAFDADMLKRENLEARRIIDTHKIAQHLDTDATIPRYSLQYLRYYLDLDVENAPAHDALGDVRVLEKLFEKLFEKMISELSGEEKVIEKMLEVSAKPIFVKRFNFGKYRDMLVGEVAMNDPGYLRWLLEEKIKVRDGGGDNDENWIYTLEHYLGK